MAVAGLLLLMLAPADGRRSTPAPVAAAARTNLAATIDPRPTPSSERLPRPAAGSTPVPSPTVTSTSAKSASEPAVAPAAVPSAPGEATPSPPKADLGVLLPTMSSVDALRSAGITTVELQVGWLLAEPQPGTLSSSYLASIRSEYAQYRAAGLKVVLDAGVQYPPAWVFDLDGATRFVDQYGDEWHGSSGADVPDAVFDLKVRAAQAEYLRELAGALSAEQFSAIRVGGLYNDELHYPPANYNGHGNAYWAFSAAATSSSPVPAYRPGQPDVSAATAFLAWYLKSINDYGTWLAGVCRAAFGPSPRLQVLLPSWGIRPGEIALAEQGGLAGGSSGELHGTVNAGLDWAGLLPGLVAVGGVVAYTTWLDAPDLGSGIADVSPVAYLSSLARPLKLPVAGENTGGNSTADMRRCLQRVTSLGLVSMMWMDGAQLADPHYASLADYGRLIRELL